MKDVACEDNRCRGMFQFLGANKTGRFSGRNVQLQNLPRNTMKELFEVRLIIKNRDEDILELLYDNAPDILSQLIRTAFVPKENMKFYVADFSSIEARVIAWLAGETW
jgi:DNA-directed DNA polymerase